MCVCVDDYENSMNLFCSTLPRQTSQRLRRSRGFFNATRKFFAQATGSGQPPPAVPSAPSLLALDSSNSLATVTNGGNLSDGNLARVDYPSSQETKELSVKELGVYSNDSVELQMRRLADLSFLFQLYEQAHQIYDVLKKDFRASSAWIYYAGAQVSKQQLLTCSRLIEFNLAVWPFRDT